MNANEVTIDKDVDFTSYFVPKSANEEAEVKSLRSFSVKEIAPDERQITAVASAEIIDRDNEIVTAAAMRKAMKAYMANPIILAGHNHRLQDGRSPVVGKVVSYSFQGKRTLITVEFADTELGNEYWKLYRDRFQRAFSIGFRGLEWADETHAGKRVRIFKSIELFEISCVTVPANPAALSKSKSFVQQKKIEAEKLRILNDDEAFCKLLDRYDELTYEHGDAFLNIPPDSEAWEKFTPAEVAVLKDFQDSCGSDDFEDFSMIEDCCGGDIDDESDRDIGKSINGLESKSKPLSLAGAIAERERKAVQAFGSKELYEKYKKYKDLMRCPGRNPESYGFSEEEIKLFELVESNGVESAIEHVKQTPIFEGPSFVELVGKR
ncbi:MAG: HK97 family phage prohead protease [Phycisphaerae bacterium]|nr:HK97 family phage prohead protease [Phycisphaerae bacterium]